MKKNDYVPTHDDLMTIMENKAFELNDINVILSMVKEQIECVPEDCVQDNAFSAWTAHQKRILAMLCVVREGIKRISISLTDAVMAVNPDIDIENEAYIDRYR